MNADEKRKVFEELLEGYQDVISSEFSYEDGEREAERKAWLNKYDGIKEPLIKDEKIRKVVRAWAEMHNIKKVFYCEYSWKNNIAWMEDAGDDESMINGESLCIDIPIIGVKNREYYTIAELCGGEEE